MQEGSCLRREGHSVYAVPLTLQAIGYAIGVLHSRALGASLDPLGRLGRPADWWEGRTRYTGRRELTSHVLHDFRQSALGLTARNVPTRKENTLRLSSGRSKTRLRLDTARREAAAACSCLSLQPVSSRNTQIAFWAPAHRLSPVTEEESGPSSAVSSVHRRLLLLTTMLAVDWQSSLCGVASRRSATSR